MTKLLYWHKFPPSIMLYMALLLILELSYICMKKFTISKDTLDLLVLLAEHLLDHHTGAKLETGYFL